jgi:hypothetical protein
MNEELSKLPWNLTCEIACLAMCSNITFEQAVYMALVKYRQFVQQDDAVR